MALAALACGGRTLGDGFEDEWEVSGPGASGSGSTGTGTTGSGTTGSGATGSGATGSGTGGTGAVAGTNFGGFGGTGALTGTGGFANGGVIGVGATGGVIGVGGFAGMAGAGGFAGMAGAGGFPPCLSPTLPPSRAIHHFEELVSVDTGYGIYVYTDTLTDDTPWSYGSIHPAVGTDLSAGLRPALLGNAFNLFGFTFTPDSWGAGLGVSTQCVDAREYNGIGFYVKSNVWVRVSVTIPENLPVFDGGECSGDYSTCVQSFIDVEPSSGFKGVSIPWSQLSSGKPASFDPSRILAINFQAIPPFIGGGFDLWIDRLIYI